MPTSISDPSPAQPALLSIGAASPVQAPPCRQGASCARGIIRVTFENAENGWRVLKVDVNGAIETWVGVMPPVVVGIRVRGVGRQESNAKFGGEQLKTESVMVLHPRTLDGIERYLGSGLVKGIGPKTAERIVAHFGLATLDVLDNRVGRLKEIKGIGKKAIQRIHESWEEQRRRATR